MNEDLKLLGAIDKRRGELTGPGNVALVAAIEAGASEEDARLIVQIVERYAKLSPEAKKLADANMRVARTAPEAVSA